MLDENRFIEEVWKKYEIETRVKKKDKFYEKKQYKASNNKLLLKTVASFLLVITITVSAIGGTYAVVQKYTKEEVNKKGQIGLIQNLILIGMMIILYIILKMA